MAFVEVRELRPAIGQLGDQLTHRQPPIAEMDVADDVVAGEAEHALDALADDRRPEMADVQLLGDVGPPVVDDDHLGVRGRHTETIVVGSGREVACDRVVGHGDVDETGPGDAHVGQRGIVGHELHDGRSDLARVPSRGARGGQCTVALELCEIGPL